jgi:hypothetical protein
MPDDDAISEEEGSGEKKETKGDAEPCGPRSSSQKRLPRSPDALHLNYRPLDFTQRLTSIR